MAQYEHSDLPPAEIHPDLVGISRGFLGYLYLIADSGRNRHYHAIHYPMRKVAWVMRSDLVEARLRMLTDVATIQDVASRLP